MTYNEWRDELKSNLLCVPENERRRVLDYYAEAYADRRDAGFSEREIIEDFGAPYDAAQRILSENRESFTENYYERPESQAYSGGNSKNSEYDSKREERERRREEKQFRREEERARREENSRRERERQSSQSGAYDYYQTPPPPPPQPKKEPREDYTWVFVLLCIIFCIPLFSLVMAMVGISISLCVAPFGVLISGVVVVGGGLAALFTGNAAAGACSIGIGLIIIGVCIILIPLCIKLVKLMWKLFGKFFSWLKSLFSGKEKA